jgi:hypothetical protein
MTLGDWFDTWRLNWQQVPPVVVVTFDGGFENGTWRLSLDKKYIVSIMDKVTARLTERVTVKAKETAQRMSRHEERLHRCQCSSSKSLTITADA